MPNVLVSKIIPRAKQIQQREGIQYNAALKKASAEYRAGKIPAAPEKGNEKKPVKNATIRNKKSKKDSGDEADGLGDVLVKPLKLKRSRK